MTTKQPDWVVCNDIESALNFPEDGAEFTAILRDSIARLPDGWVIRYRLDTVRSEVYWATEKDERNGSPYRVIVERS